MILVLILIGVSAWINFMERKKETIFSSAGIQIRVLEAEAQGGLIKNHRAKWAVNYIQ